MSDNNQHSPLFVLDAASLDMLIQAIAGAGFRVLGPVVSEQTIVYDRITSAEDLPRGWTAEQDKGSYRLLRRNDDAYFGYASTLDAWKKFMHPPRRKLWDVTRTGQGMEFSEPEIDDTPLAFLGVRSCDLHAIEIRDRVFANGTAPSPPGIRQRDDVFIVAVNCTAPAATCFCTSMGTGPRVSLGSDLVMTEVLQGEDHYFLLASGSPKGGQILESLALPAAQPGQCDAAAKAVDEAAVKINHGPRAMESADLKDLLYRNYNNPQWDDVASRCLSCANCTMVCPTCFCSSVEDVTDVAGNHAQRWERWDSCFTLDYSYIHGGAVRESTRSRYRQWMTHKLASWEDQFGTSGCVGCGRCIAWCPVGIDITEEVTSIRIREMS